MKMHFRKLGEVIVLILSIGIVLGAIYLSGMAYAAPHGARSSGENVHGKGRSVPGVRARGVGTSLSAWADLRGTPLSAKAPLQRNL